MKNYLILFLFTVILTSACNTANYLYKRRPPITNSVTFNEVKVTPKKNSSFLKPALPKIIDILHIDVDIQFNMKKHLCFGKEIITLKPYFFDTDTILFDAKNMIFNTVEVTNKHGDIIQNEVVYNKKVLKIKLEKKVTNTDTLKVKLHYTAQPDLNDETASAAIKDTKGLYFINTDKKEPNKPTQIWTQGETEANSNWLPFIDRPDEKFTSSLTITTDKKYTILSNGERTLSTISDSTKTEKWENIKPMSGYLLMMAIGEFDKTTDTTSNMEISYYVENEFKPFASAIFSNTANMIDFFGMKLGVKYPWNKYSQIIVRDYVSGAMENTTASLFGDFVQKNNRQLLDANNEDIIAHELFHQWFGDLVTCKTWSHLVLNEGFATYGEQLWHEFKYGSEAALIKSNNRLERYLNYVKNNEDVAIVHSNFKKQDDMFNAITYQKGASVLNLLRSEIGDEAFFTGLKNYLHKYLYNNAELDDLRKEFEVLIGKDLQPFFHQWFLKPGHPIINVRYSYNDSTQLTEITVEQAQSAEVGLYQFPLSFKVQQGNNKNYYTFPIEKKREVFYVKKMDETDAFFPNIIVDPKGVFVGEINDYKSFFYHIKTYNDASNYIEKYRALKELAAIQSQNDSARFTLLSAINDANSTIRLKSLEWVDWQNAQNYVKAKDMLIYLAEKDENSSVRAKAIAILGDKREPFLLNTYFNLVEDSSYLVAGNALEAIQKLIPEEALHISPNLEKQAKGKLFTAISSLYATHGNSSNVSFFTKNIMHVFGKQRVELLNDYTQLAIKINQPEILIEAAELLSERAEFDENGLIRYSSILNLNELNNHFSIQKNQTNGDEMKTYFENESNLMQQNIKALIQNENDEYVLGLLKLKGLYSGTKVEQ